MEELEKKIKAINEKLAPSIHEDEVLIYHPEFEFEKTFELDKKKPEKVLNEIKDYLKIHFIENKGLYKPDYYELLVNIADAYWIDTLGNHYSFSLERSTTDNDKISYEITPLSDDLQHFLEAMLSDFFADGLVSLKIYNIDTVLQLTDKDDRQSTANGVAKSIIFEIAHKTSLDLTITDISELDDTPYYESTEEAKAIKKTVIERTYDKDLIGYYYRALQMTASEFKYLAFYQVLECIFDEVYLAETIEDSRRIINASHFSTENNKDLEDLIDVINRYNKDKNDRTKTQLVLEKYFKGEIHKEAYLVANKDIVEMLKNDIKKIKKDDEAWDLQRLSNIIYDFRSECTHSNRAYPIKREFEKTKEELISYIEVIRRIAATVIMNYKK